VSGRLSRARGKAERLENARSTALLWRDVGTSVSLRSIKMTLFGREFGWGGTFNKR